MMEQEHIKPDIGIHIGISFPEYRSWQAVNHHSLWRLKTESPYHAKWEQEHGEDETEAMAFGSLTDFVLLEPARFKEQAVVEPETGEGLAPRRPTDRQRNAKKPSPATIAAIEFWDSWDEANEGKIVVTASDYEKVLQISAQVRKVQSHEFICGGRSQVCIVWEDKETGLLCKGRLDYERSASWNHIITDLKTVRSAKMERFAWAIFEYGYFQQMAFYYDGWKVLTGEDSSCVWLCVEKHGDCICKPWEAMAETIQAGQNSYRAALETWAKCVKANDWPAYGGVELIGLNQWQLEACGVGRYQA